MNNFDRENAVAKKVAEMIKDKGVNAEVVIKDITGIKNIGIALGDGEVRPTVYPDFNTNNINKMVDDLIKTYEEHKDDGKELKDKADVYGDIVFVKENIIPCVVPKAGEGLVSKQYLDLEVILRCMILNGEASIAVRKEHLSMWEGITEEELFEVAMNNIKEKFVDISMREALGIPFTGDFLRVVTTENKHWGASALLFPELFQKYGDGVRILPSSVHEVLVLVDRNGNDAALVDMITSINQSEVSPDEVLSNHPYTLENGEIREVA